MFFTGKFYAVTAYSIFEIWVDDLQKSPQIRKMAFKGDSPKVTPVGGFLLGGFYVAITAKGLYRYRAERHQHELLEGGVLRPRLEEVENKSWRAAMCTVPIVGLFMKRTAADDCYEKNEPAVFDARWHGQTREVLAAVGHFHPLVTISTQGEWAVPAELLPPNDRI